ncbi:hypothetical protein NDI56_16990 [Haloarcula sp. S1CR25-12]|uniref:Histidine kinase n=1 Tax=Haloarcula saliterrae TaxID=2950534 RepID=A0ABU2FFT6_9EURY|nr:hypothetical protein [Haloarcula sp. S1CR25-12]MDS0261097.1 hypothetical protein [Haloarcula sp. S1CR25-12]
MSDSIEIVFVLDRRRTTPTAEQLQTALAGSAAHEASVSSPETVYMTDTTDGPGVGCTLDVYDADADRFTLPSLPAVVMGVTLSQLQSEEYFQENLMSLLSHVRYVYESLDDCRYVYGLDDEHFSRIDKEAGPGRPVTEASLSENRLETVSWLMLFSPPLVAEYDREWLLDAPVWQTRELDDGAVMLVASPDPTDWEEFRAARTELGEYFDRSG